MVFSMLKIVKSKARNRLSQGSLDQILRIKLESPGKLGDESLEELLMMFKQHKEKQSSSGSSRLPY